MIYKFEELKEMIPLYLNGTLSEAEKKIFEEAIEKIPELKKEFLEFLEIKNSYMDIQKEVTPPSKNLYKKISERIGAKKESETLSTQAYPEKIKEFFKNLFSSSVFSWGLVVVELIVIFLLILYLPKEEKYRTLTAEHHLKGGAIINIVFDSEAKEKEIREVLTKIGANIVSGPTPEGLYKIELKKEKDLESALKYLKKIKIVKFAERAYQDEREMHEKRDEKKNRGN